MMYFLLHNMKRADPKVSPNIFSSKVRVLPSYFRDSSTATATLTVIPTWGCYRRPGSSSSQRGGGGRRNLRTERYHAYSP
jgi:hypothetical protein